MFGMNVVDEELRRGLGLSMKEVEPFLRAGGDAAEIKFMECCWCLWKANGAELVEPFIDAAFNKLPEKSRCVLFQRMLTIVYVAQDDQQAQTPPPRRALKRAAASRPSGEWNDDDYDVLADGVAV